MTALASPGQLSPFAVFRNRSFTLLWTAQLISSMGTALTSLAASILVYRLWRDNGNNGRTTDG